MKQLRALIILPLLAVLFVISCKDSKKMTPEDFLQIQNEIFSTDLTPEAKENIAKKYGYTLKQYRDFEENLENDPELKAKVGEIRLNMEKGE